MMQVLKKHGNKSKFSRTVKEVFGSAVPIGGQLKIFSPQQVGSVESVITPNLWLLFCQLCLSVLPSSALLIIGASMFCHPPSCTLGSSSVFMQQLMLFSDPRIMSHDQRTPTAHTGYRTAAEAAVLELR